MNRYKEILCEIETHFTTHDIEHLIGELEDIVEAREEKLEEERVSKYQTDLINPPVVIKPKDKKPVDDFDMGDEPEEEDLNMSNYPPGEDDCLSIGEI